MNQMLKHLNKEHSKEQEDIDFQDIGKDFGSFHALTHIELSLKLGKIYGIVGENGAGKTTLMNILYGLYGPTTGTMQLFGELYAPKSPSHAIQSGINMVHQHFMLIDYYTCLENIILGNTSFFVRRSLMRAKKKVESIVKDLEFDIDLNTKVETLPVGLKQTLEIIRALYKGTKILILDEPTAVLTPIEVQRFFLLLRKLQEQGITILLITHKLREVLEITDNVVVMRRGQVVHQCKTDETTAQELTQWMIGRDLQIKRFSRTHSPSTNSVIRAVNVNYTDKHKVQRLKGINFAVHKGEILGVAGVTGNGQSELIQLMLSIISPSSGDIFFQKYKFTKKMTSRNLRTMGMGFVPEDRLKEGLVRHFMAYENIILGYHIFPDYSNYGFISSAKIAQLCLDKMKEFNVQPQQPKKEIRYFSGGNQQKIIVAREMMHSPKAMIIAEPTRGVDVGAIEQIHKQIMSFREQGCAILLISSELEELLNLSDRILVLYKGHQSTLLNAEEINETTVGKYMMGMEV